MCVTSVKALIQWVHIDYISATRTVATYWVIKNDCRGFNNLSYTIQYTIQEYIVAPMDQEILKVFFYDVQCVDLGGRRIIKKKK
jgi:hypothetical protein